jgi:hypothetical protein
MPSLEALGDGDVGGVGQNHVEPAVTGPSLSHEDLAFAPERAVQVAQQHGALALEAVEDRIIFPIRILRFLATTSILFIFVYLMISPQDTYF